MSFARNYRQQGGTYHDRHWSSFNRDNCSSNSYNNYNYNRSWNDNHVRNYNNFHSYSGKFREHYQYDNPSYITASYVQPNNAPSFKRRKFSASAWGDSARNYLQVPNEYETAVSSFNQTLVPPVSISNIEVSTSMSCKRDRSKLEDDEPVFMSRDEIERFSPSRKDGIDALRETHLRYSYCAFIQNLGLRLEL